MGWLERTKVETEWQKDSTPFVKGFLLEWIDELCFHQDVDCVPKKFGNMISKGSCTKKYNTGPKRRAQTSLDAAQFKGRNGTNPTFGLLLQNFLRGVKRGCLGPPDLRG